MLLILHWLCDLIGFPRHRMPVLTLFKYTKHAVIGVAAPLSIKSKYAESAFVAITHSDGVKVGDVGIPTNCIISIKPQSTADMTIAVTLEPRAASRHLFEPVEHIMVVPVRQNPPRLRIRVPWIVRALENGRIGWRAPDVSGVAIEIDDGVSQVRKQTHQITAFWHKFQTPGRTILRFIAEDRYSLAAAIRTVWVLPPRKPRIRIDNIVQCGRPGQPVTFAWSVSHADEVWIEELFRNQTHKVSIAGSFTVHVSTITEQFVLAARGPGGVCRKRLRSIPWLGLESPN